MLPDRVSNPGPLTYESGALPIALRGPAIREGITFCLLKGLWFFPGSSNFHSLYKGVLIFELINHVMKN